jgi:hypothetical protein
MRRDYDYELDQGSSRENKVNESMSGSGPFPVWGRLTWWTYCPKLMG